MQINLSFAKQYINKWCPSAYVVCLQLICYFYGRITCALNNCVNNLKTLLIKHIFKCGSHGIVVPLIYSSHFANKSLSDFVRDGLLFGFLATTTTCSMGRAREGNKMNFQKSCFRFHKHSQEFNASFASSVSSGTFASVNSYESSGYVALFSASIVAVVFYLV